MICQKRIVAYAALLFLLFSSSLVGCSAFRQTPITFENIPLTQYGYHELSSSLPLKIFLKDRSKYQKKIRLYIESDGASWLWNTFPPSSPTPNRAFAATLAASDTSTSIAYISRPCQFIDAKRAQDCPSELWLKSRFSADAIQIVSNAIDEIKQHLELDSTSPIDLIGYSGGGVMATLLSAKRGDVNCLVTIAAPLDLDVWTNFHKVATLNQSIKLIELPMLEIARLQAMHQSHFYGTQDTNVPFESILTIQKLLGKNAQWLNVEHFDHHGPWIGAWPELLKSTCLNHQVSSDDK